MKPLNQLFKTSLLMAAMAIVPFSTPSIAADQITIAVAGPITGQYATFGHQMKAGVEMAVADLNKAGGVLGKQLKLEIGDDACDPKQAVAIANQLANKKVALVAGHFCSGSSIPASKVYNEEGVIMISPGSTNPKLTEDGLSNVFRVCGRDDQQGAVAGEYLAKKYAESKIAILHDKSAYGKGLADETKKALNAAGKQEVMYEAITAGEKDYSAIVSKLKKEQIDVVYLGGYHTEAGLIIRQMRDQGMSTILAAGDALMTDEFWSITGTAGEGTLMTFSPDPRKNPIAEPIVTEFRAQKIEPEGYVLYSYGAVQAWAQAVEKVGSTDAKKVEAALRAETFKTVLGDISFNTKGDVNAPGYVFYEWKDGKYEYVK
ncbi:branched-chain amino acid ABC transporter substrate-binding protein [Beggiatoa leptomitoformis]|uniref:ABC transporter substrate-binding protein n=1 Tax=Beggiatoa leptomitoformis TaxID=288004 RepID=A0A2N9YFC6_9GAMM|nr:branched-chain amino acid ABC transporter substrate-binding protein [Beggiatoa leptomitoformis]ALG68493.1 ABC transporter substrate-binding protein [Beggiatoa leptomitoformis]AUI69170.1 ABC transporter substrate-binding protein [Beggiatoa leptomitoformis]